MMKTSGGGGEGMIVAEIQGLYGAFSFPEKLFQQIWLRGDFDSHAAFTADGRRVEVLHPGRWNFLGGPDFKGARLRIGDVVTSGDIELHLHAADWSAHGHAGDPAYANVVLHVVLFPGDGRFTTGAAGQLIPMLVLLPLLNHDLEAYAADAAVERLANHPLTRAHDALVGMSEVALRAELARQAERRWQQKIRYAHIRNTRLGWNEACHQTALEILGYSANRAPMLAVATAQPLSAWIENARRADAATGWVDELFAQPDTVWRWRTHGLRPANQPRTRLCQYARWVSRCPDWPEKLATLAKQLPDLALSDGSMVTREVRKQHAFRTWRMHFAAKICGEALDGSRLDTLICDGFLPLLAAREGDSAARLAGWWNHWFVGDVPANWLALLRGLNVIGARDWPASHGATQGLLGWLLSEEKKQNFGDSVEGRGT
jgi:hypothetical protein